MIRLTRKNKKYKQLEKKLGIDLITLEKALEQEIEVEDNE